MHSAILDAELRHPPLTLKDRIRLRRILDQIHAPGSLVTEAQLRVRTRMAAENASQTEPAQVKGKK